MESNSFIDAPAKANKKFRVLIYNHGYGGLTSVYQTIFEELASHGYIVVSIGHENESALLILEDGGVIANNPLMFVSSNQEGNRYLRTSTFIENSEADCYQVYIEGFAHDNFTDLEYIMEGNSEAIELQRELILGFFDKYLKNKDINLKHLESKYRYLNLSKYNKN